MNYLIWSISGRRFSRRDVLAEGTNLMTGPKLWELLSRERVIY